MRDNVLIFTEDYVSPDLTELSSYFSGCLKIDAPGPAAAGEGARRLAREACCDSMHVRAAAEIAGTAEPEPAAGV